MKPTAAAISIRSWRSPNFRLLDMLELGIVGKSDLLEEHC